MPWLSKKQEKWGNSLAGRKALGKKIIEEFNKKSKGLKLPTRVKPSKKK